MVRERRLPVVERVALRTVRRDLLDQLLFEGLLREDPNDGRPLIGLGEADEVKSVYRGERRLSVRQMPASVEASGRSCESNLATKASPAA